MRDYPEILVLRHGETTWNRAGRFQGALDSPLTARGRAQAKAMGALLARHLADPGRFRAFTSPQGRAVATADRVLAPLGLVPAQDARLAEAGFGDWQGLGWQEIAAGWPEMARRAEEEPFFWQFEAPGGESLTALRQRVTAFLDDLPGPAILVTHGLTSRVLRGVWLGLAEPDLPALEDGQGVVFHLRPGQGQSLLTPT